MLTICPYMLLHRLCRARRFETRLVLLIPMMSPQRNVGIFWDYENCEVPFTSDGYAVAAGIRGLAERYGPIRAFKAYLEASTQSTLSPRLELISSGVDIVDCPHNGKKDVVDKTLMVDMLTFALDNPPPNATIILISGDGDFMRAVASLRLRQYRMVVIAPRGGTHSGLKYQSSEMYDWYNDVVAPQLRQPATPLRPALASAAAYRIDQSAVHAPTPSVVLPAEDLSPVVDHKSRLNTHHGIELKRSDNDGQNNLNEADIQPGNDVDWSPDIPVPPMAGTGSREGNPAHSNSSTANAPATVSALSRWTLSTQESDGKTLQSASLENLVPHTDTWSGGHDAASIANHLSGPQRLYSEVASIAQQVEATTTLETQVSLAAGITLPSVVMYHNKKPPRAYKALVKVLEAQRLQGNTRVVSSVLGTLVTQEEANAYARAGTTKLKDYTAQAEKEGVVILGKEDWEHGNRWIALHPDYHGFGHKPAV